MATKKRTRRGPLPPSGPHTNPRRKVSATAEEWAAWDAHCERIDLTWAEATRNFWRMVAPVEKSTSETKKDPSDA